MEIPSERNWKFGITENGSDLGREKERDASFNDSELSWRFHFRPEHSSQMPVGRREGEGMMGKPSMALMLKHRPVAS